MPSTTAPNLGTRRSKPGLRVKRTPAIDGAQRSVIGRWAVGRLQPDSAARRVIIGRVVLHKARTPDRLDAAFGLRRTGCLRTFPLSTNETLVPWEQ